MSRLSRLIEGCAYHPQGDALGFSFEGMPVLLERHRITVYAADTEAKARRVVDWLAERAQGMTR